MRIRSRLLIHRRRTTAYCSTGHQSNHIAVKKIFLLSRLIFALIMLVSELTRRNRI